MKKISLKNKKGLIIDYVVIDDEDFNLIKNITWCKSSGGYCVGNISSRRQIKMHRLIMRCPKGKIIDHINHNKLDNRKQNLRICETKDNTKNKQTTSKNKIGCNGVYWNEKRKKYRVMIGVNGVRIFGGYYKNKKEAINKYKKMSLYYYKEFSVYFR